MRAPSVVRALILLLAPAIAQDQAKPAPEAKKPEPLRFCSSKGVVPPCAKYGPKPIRETMVDPEYSEEAREKKFTGTVVMSIIVETDGTVSDVTFQKKAGHGLDEKALEAVRNWRFEPGKLDDNTPVRTKLQITMTFRLH